MNHSIYSADRTTHLKIVVVALIGATLVAGVGIAARIAGSRTSESAQVEAMIPLLKAGAPMTFTSREAPTIR